MDTCTAHVCHEPQSRMHMFTHQIHTDTSQACTPTCHTACTHMYIPPMLHAMCIQTSHPSTAHTNMHIHTPCVCMYIHTMPYCTHLNVLPNTCTHHGYHLQTHHACIHRHKTFTQTQIPLTVCPRPVSASRPTGKSHSP